MMTKTVNITKPKNPLQSDINKKPFRIARNGIYQPGSNQPA
jgi:hypothetical protein